MTRFIKIYLKGCETVTVNLDHVTCIKYNPTLKEPTIVIVAMGQEFTKSYPSVDSASEKHTALERWLEDSNEEPIFHLY